MALSDEHIEDIATDWFSDEWAVARAIKLIEQVEAEVRKDDTALIRQLVEAAALPSMKTEAMLRQRDEAITAGRARLEQP